MKAGAMQTWSTDIFQEAENAVDGGVGKDDDVVDGKKHVEHIEHGRHVLLTTLVYFLVSRVLYLHRTQRTEQRLPAAPDVRRARLHQLTDGADHLPCTRHNINHWCCISAQTVSTTV